MKNINYSGVLGKSKEDNYYLILGVYIIEYRLISNLLIGGKEGVNIIRLITCN